ncbi:hypothetical protein AQS8620_00270 [Aquimixticola soesokkakensis]|uniref:Uncharacterized protein n=1 Tax=Aquimixticola soesokkakensis TaxID=1519096 RepID=A0A1Y5RFB8_9RHOB|nr:glycosyltransferase [Aquimixticola soesokkakensis]SLN15262.1 hypothetical protein AQS8620_00270 [Aquimixticola soesokkakensis]
MKIAFLSQYPISTPLHGGQRRMSAIVEVTRSAGHEVLHVPLFFAQYFPEGNALERETAFDAAHLKHLTEHQLREDLDIVEGAQHSAAALERAVQKLRNFAPDVIHFEQPWLYRLLETVIDSDPGLAKTQLVYGSQNVESQLIDPAFASRTAEIEGHLVRKADLVVAVSTADAAAFDAMRPDTARPTVLAPNGCWAPDVDAPQMSNLLTQDYALVAGSAHPPNAEGYWDCVGTLPGFLPPRSQIVIVGGMNNLLGADRRYQFFRLLNSNLVTHMGQVPEEKLTALLQHAKVIALPITEGGGTNLKTAEALMWLKPVVAMRPAMRGYEAMEGVSGVYIADTPRAFRRLMRDAMTGALTSARTAQEVARYAWPAQLAPLVAAYQTATV